MPAFFSDLGREVWLNCGLRAERGTERTSTTRVTPCARSSSMNSSIGRVEWPTRSEEHTSELQSRQYLVCRLLLEKKKTRDRRVTTRPDSSLISRRCRA